MNHKEMKGVEVRRDDDDDPQGDDGASPNGFEPQEDDPEGDDESKMEMIRRKMMIHAMNRKEMMIHKEMMSRREMMDHKETSYKTRGSEDASGTAASER